MYGKTEGFIARVDFGSKEKYPQKMFKPDKLISNNTYDRIPDVYTSMNTFKKWKSRTIENIRCLNALYIDIDCYKLGFTPEQVIFTLEQDYYNTVIPCPTFTIKSGRGLYLIWKIYNGEDKSELPVWEKIQEYLCDRLSKFGADRQSIDAARILRVPYSVHSMSGNTVKIMDFDDVQYTLDEIEQEFNIDYNADSNKSKFFVNKTGIHKKQRWGEATARQIKCATEIGQEQDLTLPDFKNFDETFEFIGRYAQRRFRSDKSATEKQRRYAEKIAKEKGVELPDFNSFIETGDFIARHSNKKSYGGKSFLEYWLRDIEKLIMVLRKGEDCCRELCLFLNRLWLCETTHDYEEALRKTLKLNKRLDKPFTESYVRSHTQSAEEIIKRMNKYRYTKKNIIEMLNITDDEMRDLKYLNNLTKKEREKVRKQKAYERHLEETSNKTKKEKIRERREAIAEMLNAGKTEKEICEALNITRSTYYRDKTILIGQGLVKCAVKTVSGARKMANEIRASIANVIREAYENIKELTNMSKKRSDPEHDILKQLKKVQIKR